MTKKHFIQLAKILADVKDWPSIATPETMRQCIGKELTLFCEDQNPRFDRSKFRQAAKLPE